MSVKPHYRKYKNMKGCCSKCNWYLNIRKVEVQVIPTHADFEIMFPDGGSYSYMPLMGELEIYWCPECRKIVDYHLTYDYNEVMGPDDEEGYINGRKK